MSAKQLEDTKEMYDVICREQFQSVHKRLDEQNINIKNNGRSISAVREKVFNGFDARISNTEKNVSDLKSSNKKEHFDLRRDIQAVRSLVIWLFVVGGFNTIGLVVNILGIMLKFGITP